MHTNEVDIDDLFTVQELAARYARVMSQSTLRYQLRDREKNGLAAVCVQLGKKLLISDSGYRRWLGEAQAKSRQVVSV